MIDGAAVETADKKTKRSRSKSAGAFRTISEVASELNVPSHVLRFWETRFSQIKPMKRGGGRRYYRPEDIGLLRRIRSLLYDDGYTIKGVQKLFRDGSLKKLLKKSTVPDEEVVVASKVAHGKSAVDVPEISTKCRTELQELLEELVALRKILNEF